jgi:hypothetical protein
MRIEGHTNSLETNVEGERQEFGIGNASKIIKILRDYLYKNKVQTLVQEYICNARDAMREVGKGNQFEITVPTKLSPVFKVRDFGPGITPDRMKNVFIMYGSSTKTNTNSQTGGFGIGAKSAWAYTDSFMVVTVVDGTRRTYAAHVGSNDNGRLDLLSTEETKEANGTEIQVAVQPYDVDEFRRAVFRATYFWVDKPTFKGELHPPTLVRGEVVSDLVEVIDRDLLPEYVRMGHYGDELLAVIDGIPYVISGDLTRKIKSLPKLNTICKGEVILHFGNGVVGVSASRESIDDGTQTQQGLEKLAAKGLLQVQTHISDAFNKVTTNAEYLQTYSKLSKLFDTDKYAKFGVYSIKHGAVLSPLLKKVRLTVVHCLNRRGHRIQKVTKTELTEAKKEIQIKDLNHLFYNTSPETKIQQNKRVRAYMEENTTLVLIEPLLVIEYKDAKDQDGKDIRVESNRYLDTASYDQVVKDLSARSFQSITYVEEPKVKKAKTKREDAAICLHTMDRNRHSYTTMATNNQTWLYVHLCDGMWPQGLNKNILDELDTYLKADSGLRICGLAERAMKMVKGDKNFSPLEDWLKAYKPSKDSVTRVKYDMARNNESVELIKRLKDIKDPFLVYMVGEYGSLKSKVGRVPEILAEKIRATKEVKDFVALDKKLGKVMNSEYPLVDELKYSQNKAEIVFYVNAKFASKKGKK